MRVPDYYWWLRTKQDATPDILRAALDRKRRSLDGLGQPRGSMQQLSDAEYALLNAARRCAYDESLNAYYRERPWARPRASFNSWTDADKRAAEVSVFGCLLAPVVWPILFVWSIVITPFDAVWAYWLWHARGKRRHSGDGHDVDDREST